jgi:hypothetical protein
MSTSTRAAIVPPKRQLSVKERSGGGAMVEVESAEDSDETESRQINFGGK